MGTGIDRSRVRERGEGQAETGRGQGLGGAGTQREQTKAVERKANRSRERQKGSQSVGPSLLGCLSARLGSASSKPLLKLLHVETRRPGGRQPDWKAARARMPGTHAPRGVALGQGDAALPCGPHHHTSTPPQPSRGTVPHPKGRTGLDEESSSKVGLECLLGTGKGRDLKDHGTWGGGIRNEREAGIKVSVTCLESTQALCEPGFLSP